MSLSSSELSWSDSCFGGSRPTPNRFSQKFSSMRINSAYRESYSKDSFENAVKNPLSQKYSMCSNSGVGLLVRQTGFQSDYKVLWSKKDGLISSKVTGGCTNNYIVGNWFHYMLTESENEKGGKEDLYRKAFLLEMATCKPRRTCVNDGILQAVAILEERVKFSDQSFVACADTVLGTILCAKDETLMKLMNSIHSFVKVIAIYKEGYHKLSHWIAVEMEDQNGQWRKLSHLPNEIDKFADHMNSPNECVYYNSSGLQLNAATDDSYDEMPSVSSERQSVKDAVSEYISNIVHSYEEWQRLCELMTTNTLYPPIHIPNEVKSRVTEAISAVFDNSIIPPHATMSMVPQIKDAILQRDLVIVKGTREIYRLRYNSSTSTSTNNSCLSVNSVSTIPDDPNCSGDDGKFSPDVEKGKTYVKPAYVTNVSVKKDIPSQRDSSKIYRQDIEKPNEETIIEDSKSMYISPEMTNLNGSTVTENLNFVNNETEEMDRGIHMSNPSNGQNLNVLDNSSNVQLNVARFGVKKNSATAFQLPIIPATLSVTESDVKAHITGITKAFDEYNKLLSSIPDSNHPFVIPNEIHEKVNQAMFGFLDDSNGGNYATVNQFKLDLVKREMTIVEAVTQIAHISSNISK